MTECYTYLPVSYRLCRHSSVTSEAAVSEFMSEAAKSYAYDQHPKNLPNQPGSSQGNLHNIIVALSCLKSFSIVCRPICLSHGTSPCDTPSHASLWYAAVQYSDFLPSFSENHMFHICSSLSVIFILCSTFCWPKFDFKAKSSWCELVACMFVCLISPTYDWV